MATTAAIIGAVAAAASAAAAARQQSAQRRAQANAAQASKQGLAASSTPQSSVADSLMGQMNAGNMTRIKDMIQGGAKPVAGAADAALPQAQPGAQPGEAAAMPSLPQGQGSFAAMQGAGQQQSLQQAVPDYSTWMKQFGGNF